MKSYIYVQDVLLSVEVRPPCSRVSEQDGEEEDDDGSSNVNVVPAQGDIVTAKVLSVNPRSAKLHLLCVREAALSEPYRATLRREDVRATEKDRVEMYKACRPGDVLLARVLSMGEASSGFLVTTAENELGVVIAYSEASGAKMVPVREKRGYFEGKVSIEDEEAWLQTFLLFLCGTHCRRGGRSY